MTDPTVEEVREALDLHDSRGPFAEDHWTQPIVAAVRLWVAAAEPDIEAAEKVFDEIWSWGDNRMWAEAAVAAVFGDNTLIRRAE